MKFSALISLFLVIGTASAQQLVFSDPVKLGPSVNSEAEELAPLLSADGKILYFSRAFDKENTGGPFAGLDIWQSYKVMKNTWATATNKGTKWNNKESNVVVGINKDNTSVYLLNSYKNKNGIAFSKKLNGEWTSPDLIPIQSLDRADFVGYFMNESFDVLLISMNGKGSVGNEDLYVSQKDSTGTWSRPVNLGPTINTEGFEISPFLSADGMRLYFTSNGHGGSGDADIFYSDRLFNSWETWSIPKNLGPKINSPGFDGYLSTYGDTVAFFVSNRGGGKADIYQSSIQTLDPKTMAKTYLTNEEIAQIVGKVNREIKFERTSVTLSAAQNEFLFYMVNKVITQQDVKFEVTISKDDTGLAERRLNTVTDKLKMLGISRYRIDSSILDKKTDPGVVKINFFK